MEDDVMIQKIGGRKFILMLLIIFMCIPAILWMGLPKETVVVLGDIVIYVVIAGMSGNAIEYLSKLKLGKAGGSRMRDMMSDDCDEDLPIPKRKSRN
jgi:hypothetical protein